MPRRMWRSRFVLKRLIATYLCLGCFVPKLCKALQSSFQHFQAGVEKPTDFKIRANGRLVGYGFAWKHHVGNEEKTSWFSPHDEIDGCTGF
jgi:hypothetical protein